jgi:hypothetical protein
MCLKKYVNSNLIVILIASDKRWPQSAVFFSRLQLDVLDERHWQRGQRRIVGNPQQLPQ